MLLRNTGNELEFSKRPAGKPGLGCEESQRHDEVLLFSVTIFVTLWILPGIERAQHPRCI